MTYISEFNKCLGSKRIDIKIVPAKAFYRDCFTVKKEKFNNLICLT